MKKSLLSALSAALLCATAFAQNNQGRDPFAAAPAPPAAHRMDRVQFIDARLAEIVEYIQQENDKAGGNPDAFNVIVSPGLENKMVPSLSLRKVSGTEVLSIACTVLGLKMDPVMGDDGSNVIAWIVKEDGEAKALAAATGEGGGAIAGGIIGVGPASAGFVSPAPFVADNFQFNPWVAGIEPVTGTPGLVDDGSGAPAVVQLATGGGGGGLAVTGMSAPAKPVAKVFGIASLIASSQADRNDREKERAMKFERVITTLQKLADDQGRKTDVKAYGEMDIIVVKSEDLEAINLIAEAIEAMKTNASAEQSSDNGKATAQQYAMQAEMAALKSRIEMLTHERDLIEKRAAQDLERATQDVKRALKDAEKPGVR